ncbi:transketolase C-terminal domain-containing protein [soil metagenome]
MRTTFIEALCEIAAEDERIWLLNGDLGYSVIERFSARFPERSINVGVAEQNMTGVAAGLALCDKIVFTYSIANFPTLRCLEQIRNDVCYHNLSVKVVAIGGGLAYGAQGYTHHAIEDLAIMRALPNMKVIAPGDPAETRAAVRALVDSPGPCYLRLGKAGEPVVHQGSLELTPGKAICLREGMDAAILSTGGMLKTAAEAVELCAKQGRIVALYSMPWIKPFDEELIRDLAARFALLLTVEEARASGGLGGAVAEILASEPSPRARLLRLGFEESQISNTLLHSVHTQEGARSKLSLDAAGLARRLIANL